jgi:hypothetical protein
MNELKSNKNDDLPVKLAKIAIMGFMVFVSTSAVSMILGVIQQ